MNKETKTRSELEEMLLQRAAGRSDCAEIAKVAVTPGEAGWRVVTILKNGHMVRSFKPMDDIAAELITKYALSSSDDE